MAWAPDYVDLAVMRAYLRITDEADTADDSQITLAVAAASRAVDRACYRQFGKVGASETRYATAYWSRREQAYVADIDDLHDSDGLAVTSSGTAVTEFTLLPRNAIPKGRPYSRIRFTGSVSCRADAIALTSDSFGWADIPDAIVQATQIQAARFVKRRDAPFGVAGSPEMGNELRLLQKLDPDVEVTVQPFRRMWGAA